METGGTDTELESASKAHPPPFIVTLSPFTPIISPSSRRLSSCFTQRFRPIRAARQLAWVSLQGRLIGAEEATSARTLARENCLALNPIEAVAWELFSPIHRILIVAVIAVAAANSKGNNQILQLKKAVELRDQVLLSMQEKLDNLCEQVNYFNDQPQTDTENYGCQLCQQHKDTPINFMGNSVFKKSDGGEMFKQKQNGEEPEEGEMFKQKQNGEEPEERRVSDLSDWASSVTSCSEIQLNSLAIEQDIYNLKKESEDKDATIKELSALIHSSEAYGSKRIAELEDIIRRKNMTITMLKEDLLVLEQKVINLTRVRRSSFSGTLKTNRQQPLMLDNLLYDMDSTTGPSSSDSDCSSPVKHSQATIAITQDKKTTSDEEKQLVQRKISASLLNPRANCQVPATPSPLKEKSLNQKVNTASNLRSKLNSSANEYCKSRKPSQTRSKDANASKRWV